MMRLKYLGLFLTLSLVNLSCLKKLSEEPPLLGPEASESQLELEFAKAIYGIDPRAIQVGQAVRLTANMRIENQEQVRPLGETQIRVAGRRENEAALCIHLIVQDFPAGGAPSEPKQEDLVFWKTEPTNTNPCSDAPNAKSAKLSLKNQTLPASQLIKGAGSQEKKKVIRVSYHNLKTERGAAAPPESVRRRPQCGGVEGCSLPITRIRFDMAEWFNSEEYQVTRHDLVISSRAPYLAAILDRCISGMVGVDGRLYYVRQCEFVSDFIFHE